MEHNGTYRIKKPDFNYPIYAYDVSKKSIDTLKRYFQVALSTLPENKQIYIWFTGTSGVCIFSMMKTLLPGKTSNILPVPVRKPTDTDNHHNSWGHNASKANKDDNGYHIFLDDCVASGKTFREVSKVRFGYFNEVWITGAIGEDSLEFLKKENISKCISGK